MSQLPRALLQSRLPLLEARRFRGKINIQRPRKPHFERQLLIDITKPYFFNEKRKEIDLCDRGVKIFNNDVVDNPFERILARECLNWFNTSKMVTFLHMNSISMEEKSKIFIALRKQDMHLRVYGKKIVSMATAGTHLEAVNKLFTSHQNIIFAQNENVGKMLKILKKAPQMVVLAGIVNNQLLSRNELIAFSQLPDLKTAQSQLCAVLQSAGSGLVGQLNHHQQILVSQLDQYAQLNSTQETKEENDTKEQKTETPAEG